MKKIEINPFTLSKVTTMFEIISDENRVLSYNFDGRILQANPLSQIASAEYFLWTAYLKGRNKIKASAA